jgi:hypothetical protein
LERLQINYKRKKILKEGTGLSAGKVGWRVLVAHPGEKKKEANLQKPPFHSV